MPVDTECYEKLVIFLSAKGLPRLGAISGKMDAFAVLYQVDPYTHRLSAIGHTEVVKESTEPSWTTSFTLNYHFEAIQEYLVQVFHHDGTSAPQSVVASGFNQYYNPASAYASAAAVATAGAGEEGASGKGGTVIGHSSMVVPILAAVGAGGAGACAAGVGKGAGHRWVGDMRFMLSSLMCAPSQCLSKRFVGDAPGSVEIRGEVMHHTRDNLVVTFAGNKLRNKEGFFSTSDPFLKISRFNEDGTYTAVWQSEYISSNLNPRWSEACIPLVQLCNADTQRPLRIQIYDYEKSGRHHFMGQVDTTVDALLAGSSAAPMEVIEPQKVIKKGKKYSNSGTLVANSCRIEENPTFADFITGGLEISLTVAIDFTASNGDPMSPSSLHYFDPTGHLNTYQQAISAVVNVLEPYDSDHMYPVYGFGAKLKDSKGNWGKPQHCFPLSREGAPSSASAAISALSDTAAEEGQGEREGEVDVEVQGIDGIMSAYKACVPNVMLSGPTLFAPLIHAASQRAALTSCSQEKQSYSILLILTDGVINDFDASKAAIIEASRQPLSIIIVGVGNANFSEMDELDSDRQLLTHNGFTASRDIVQFVSFKEQLLKGSCSLAEAVLAEIPTQLLLYMKQNNIKPNIRQ